MVGGPTARGPDLRGVGEAFGDSEEHAHELEFTPAEGERGQGRRGLRGTQGHGFGRPAFGAPERSCNDRHSGRWPPNRGASRHSDPAPRPIVPVPRQPMLSIDTRSSIFLKRGPVDFRKGFDGLAAIVRQDFGRDPTSGDLFLFFNRRRDRLKILVFDRNGFWLHYKRLELGNFGPAWSFDGDEDCVMLERSQLLMLLEGIDHKKAKFHRHFHPFLRRDRQAHGEEERRHDRNESRGAARSG